MREKREAAGVSGGADEDQTTGDDLRRQYSTGDWRPSRRKGYMKVYFADAQEVGLTEANVLAAVRNRMKCFHNGIALGPIAEELGMSYRHLERCLKDLEKKGRLCRYQQRRGTWYTFEILDPCPSSPDKMSDEPDKMSGDSEVVSRQDVSTKRRKKEKKDSHTGRPSASPPNGGSPPAPGEAGGNGDRQSGMIVDLFAMPRLQPTETMPIAASIEPTAGPPRRVRRAERRPQSAWARENGFTTIGGGRLNE